MEGPSAIRLWPGLYFDSDTQTKITNAGAVGKKLLKGEGLAAKYQVGHIIHSRCYRSKSKSKVKVKVMVNKCMNSKSLLTVD